MSTEYEIVRKDNDAFMRFCGRILGRSFRERFWTTYRFPWMKRARVCYPRGTTSPLHRGILDHEEHHVRQFAPWYGPFVVFALYLLFPLPVLFSGRWHGFIRAGEIITV